MAGLVSMARSSEALKQDRAYGTIMPIADTTEQPVYPYGLCISLSDEELEKLKLDCDCDVGEEITFVIRCEVTSVSQSKAPEGSRSRLELQIVAMKPSDVPDDMRPDNDEDDKKSSRYGKGSK